MTLPPAGVLQKKTNGVRGSNAGFGLSFRVRPIRDDTSCGVARARNGKPLDRHHQVITVDHFLIGKRPKYLRDLLSAKPADFLGVVR